jgi:protein-tyrosine phosphatase
VFDGDIKTTNDWFTIGRTFYFRLLQLMMKSLLTVCVGNICRSPMAEGLFREAVREAGMDTKVHSAGIGALVDHPADPIAVELMKEMGIDIASHRARQISPEIIADSELILTMESWHQQEVERKFPFTKGRVFTIGKWSNLTVDDPYKKPREAFEEALVGIRKGVKDWAEYL